MRYCLRCHHLLCLSFYVGKGYSDEFVSNMDRLYYSLKDDDIICVKSSNDLLCETCPNLRDGVCNTIEKVNRYDEALLSLLGIEYDHEYSYFELKKLVYDRVIRENKLDLVCHDCEWNTLCHSVLRERYKM